MNKLDLNESLTNVSSSILKKFEVEPFHTTYAPLDTLLSKTKKKKISLVLFDGFGKNIIEKYKEFIPYIYTHIFKEFKSVYPPTTVAATTTLLTGKYPVETGFLGWNQYFSPINKFIDVFTNRDSVADKNIGLDVISLFLKPTYIFDLINKKAGKEIAFQVKGHLFHDLEGNFDMKAFFKECDSVLNKAEFSYLYSPEPDHSMHEFGTSEPRILKTILKLEKYLKTMIEKHPETLFILIADHGFVDTSSIFTKKDLELMATLKDKEQCSSIEGRFASFNVLDKTKFLAIYNQKYKKHFHLLTKDQIISENIFGIGEPHPLFYSTLGDYFLISKDEYMFDNSDDEIPFLKGAHAGATKEEIELYMMVFNR